jgi:hypothetical protein
MAVNSTAGQIDHSEAGFLEEMAMGGVGNDDALPPELAEELGEIEEGDVDNLEVSPEPNDGITDVIGSLADRQKKLEGEEPEEGVDLLGTEPVSDEPEEPQGRANKRIQQLVQDNKQIRDDYQKFQAQSQQQMQSWAQQQAQQYQLQMGELQRQNEIQTRQLELLQGRRRDEEESELPYVEKFKRQLLREAEQIADQKMSVREQTLRAEIDAIKQENAQRQQVQRQQQTLAHFEGEVEHALDAVFGEDLTFLGEENRPGLRDAVLSWIAAKEVLPMQAAQAVRKMYDLFHAGKLKSKTVAPTAQKKVPPKNVPRVSGGRRPATRGARPSWNAIQAAGYGNSIEWLADGSPDLSSFESK